MKNTTTFNIRQTSEEISRAREEGSELIVVCSPARAHSILLMRSMCMLYHVKNVKILKNSLYGYLSE